MCVWRSFLLYSVSHHPEHVYAVRMFPTWASIITPHFLYNTIINIAKARQTSTKTNKKMKNFTMFSPRYLWLSCHYVVCMAISLLVLINVSVSDASGNVPNDLSIPPPDGEDNLYSSVNSPPRFFQPDAFAANNFSSEAHEVKRYQVASFDFNHVATPYIISLWIIIVGLAKIGKLYITMYKHESNTYRYKC